VSRTELRWLRTLCGVSGRFVRVHYSDYCMQFSSVQFSVVMAVLVSPSPCSLACLLWSEMWQEELGDEEGWKASVCGLVLRLGEFPGLDGR
jgi:hypothetical protein